MTDVAALLQAVLDGDEAAIPPLADAIEDAGLLPAAPAVRRSTTTDGARLAIVGVIIEALRAETAPPGLLMRTIEELALALGRHGLE
jgi:hypothetical protein